VEQERDPDLLAEQGARSFVFEVVDDVEQIVGFQSFVVAAAAASAAGRLGRR
jgi:hypothetical protein